MDAAVRRDDMILLFDNYSVYSQDLRNSFRRSGIECPTVVIEDDGFLPDGLMSVYGYFLGNYAESGNHIGRPRYFNEIQVPDYWEISGTNRRGAVHDRGTERGRIFYAEPADKRQVRIVDWLDEKGIVRSSDHYNRWGALYARTVFNAKGQKVNKAYFSPEGREIIVENHVTGDIILNEGEKIHLFHTKTEFVLFFLRAAGLEDKRLFFNSLSFPFFVSQQRQTGKKEDVLFWQEPIRDSVPGNMQVILQGTGTHTKQIMVQKPEAFRRLMKLGADSQIVEKMGFVYSFRRQNQHQPEILICTNSDHIEHCEDFVRELPQFRFHIAALTEMSSKLLAIGNYSNVSLYPNVGRAVLWDLFRKCDYYLDINHGSEIVSAVRRAFLHNQLILAFRETLHNSDYPAEEHIFRAEEYLQMIGLLRSLAENGDLLDKELEKQQEEALNEKPQRYLVLAEGSKE